jgi:hypothetical protein
MAQLKYYLRQLPGEIEENHKELWSGQRVLCGPSDVEALGSSPPQEPHDSAAEHHRTDTAKTEREATRCTRYGGSCF